MKTIFELQYALAFALISSAGQTGRGTSPDAKGGTHEEISRGLVHCGSARFYRGDMREPGGSGREQSN